MIWNTCYNDVPNEMDNERERSIGGVHIPKADHLTKEGVLIQVGMRRRLIS